MTNPEILIGVLGTVSTIGGSYVALRLRPIEKDIDSNEKATATVKDECQVAAAVLRGDFERRIQALHDDAKTERENMERRLSGVERSYASREELAAAINAIGGRFDRGVDRMESSIKDLGVKVDSLGARVAGLEAKGN